MNIAKSLSKRSQVYIVLHHGGLITDLQIRKYYDEYIQFEFKRLASYERIWQYSKYATFLAGILRTRIRNNLSWNFFSKSMQQLKGNQVNVLVNFIYFLIEKKYYHSLYTGNLQKLKLNEHRFEREKIKRVFIKNEIEKYTLFPYRNMQILLLVNADNQRIRDLLLSFALKFNKNIEKYTFFLSHFSSSLGAVKTTIIPQSFNMKIFETQFHYFHNRRNIANALDCLRAFYLFLITEENIPVFGINDGVDEACLRRQNFSREFKSGFRIVRINPFEAIPEHDRWIIRPNAESLNTNMANSLSSFSMDFTTIACDLYKQIIKSWLWHSDKSLYPTILRIKQGIAFFNWLYGLKEKYTRNIFIHEKRSLSVIYTNEILQYRTYLQSRLKTNSCFTNVLQFARDVIYYAIQIKKIQLEKGADYYLLRAKNPYDKVNTANPIDDSDLVKLIDVVKQRQEINLTERVLAAVFCIALETELRISQIVNLKTDNIKCTAKKNQYVLCGITKTSKNEATDIPISAYLHKILNNIIQETAYLRLGLKDNEIKDYIFLYKTYHLIEHISIIQTQKFDDFLKKCCRIAGTSAYSVQSIRDTHMNKVEKYKLKKQLSDIQANILTGHRHTDTTQRFYLKHTIEELLEATHQIIIGDIRIKGRVEKDMKNKFLIAKNNTVAKECGYCSSENCVLNNTLDCLTCSHFVATVDRIPFFRIQIASIDLKINETKAMHDIESLICIKRLYVKYIEELMFKHYE